MKDTSDSQQATIAITSQIHPLLITTLRAEPRSPASPFGLVAALLVALRAEPRWSFSPSIQSPFSTTQEKTRRSGLFQYGWGWRIRTSTDGVRVRSPAVRRIPKCLEPSNGQPHRHLNVWSTADACALCADRPFCVRPHGRRESGSRHDAWGCAGLRHTRTVRGQCHDEWRRPDRWYHRL